MLKTWKVDYFPAHDKYMLDLILNEKIYPIEIGKEFAKELGDSALIDSFIEQDYINENKHLKSENAVLRERLDKAVQLPAKVGDVIYFIDGGRICGGYLEAISYLSTNRLPQEEWYSKSLIRIRFISGGIMEFPLEEYNKEWFTTREAAEARLAELKGGKDG